MTNQTDAPKAFNSLVGHRLADLEIIELLAEGATTAVYRARQATLNRQVAVKVLSAEEGRDPRLVERFTRAALAAAAVEHPGIVQVFHAAEWHGHSYVVMELVHGENLARLLEREGRLSAERALPLMKQAASAIAAAHGAGVLHGDIQPSNLLVTPAGQLKIADFSLARCSASDKGPASTGTPHSKPLYFPPEAARGRRLDARSDLYLLGATFYHVLSGRPPFEAESPEALALKAVREEPPSLSSLAPKTPPALANLIHHLLQRNPDERFQRAGDLLGALERIGAELEAERQPPALPASVPDLGQEKAGRPGVRTLAALAAVAAIALIGYAVFTLARGPRRPVTGGRVSTEGPILPEKPGPKATTEAPPTKPPTEGPKVQSKTVPPAPAWQAEWSAAETKAKALADDGRFGEAIACYEGVAEQRDDPALRDRVDAAKAALTQAAQAAYRDVATRAEQATAQGRFEAARKELSGVIERLGVPAIVSQARGLLAAVDDKERTAKAKATPPPTGTELARLREAEGVGARALEPVEPTAKAWDFAGAAAAAAKLQAASPEAAVLVLARAQELNRLAQLKGKIIKHIVTADPKLMKSTVFMPGLNGPLTDADQDAVVVSHPLLKAKKREVYRWADLSDRTVRALALGAVDRNRADDWLAVGLLDIQVGNLGAAEEDFAKARALGGDVGQHVAPLAKAALANAEALIGKRDMRGAAAELDALENTYAGTLWLKVHKEEVAAARGRVKLGLAEATADELLTRAAECLRKGEAYEARRLLTALKNDHPTSKAVTDAARKPSFAELVDAVAKLDLGRFIAVRKDGSADAKSLSEALRAATAKCLIEVQDSETYAERLVIPEDKTDLQLRAKAGCLPVITSESLPGPAGNLVEVRAERVTIEGLVLAHGSAKSLVREGRALLARTGPIRLRNAIVAVAAARTAGATPRALSFEMEAPADCEVQGCALVGPSILRGNVGARDDLWLAGRLRSDQGKFQGENLLLMDGAELGSPAEVRCCTIRGDVTFRDAPNVLFDSIVAGRTESVKAGTTVDFCILQGMLGGLARAGRSCSSAPPQFVDVRAFDFRLRPNSPGRAAASDRGDEGCRFSSAMLEALKQALELRRKGIVSF